MLKKYFLLLQLVCLCLTTLKSQTLPDIRTNEDYINGLDKEATNFDEKEEVFYQLLKSFNKHVVVYPSEHYFYYEFHLEGRPISGSILFSQEHIDSNKLFFCYVEKYHKEFTLVYKPKRIGGNGALSEKDGVFIKKKNPFLYNVTFRDVSVDFEFFDPGIEKPKHLKLIENEKFLCNGMDESGLMHSLIYNEKMNNLFYVLNEDEKTPETFYKYNDELLIGKRTEFVYYNDSINNRKILIGVFVENVLNNNWFDGPFDQLPDSYTNYETNHLIG